MYQAPVKATLTANGTITIPAGFMIDSIVFRETANHAITGGFKIGTASGAVDVAVAVTVGALALGAVLDAALLLRYFSATVDQTLFIQAVAAWNSASLNVIFYLKPGA